MNTQEPLVVTSAIEAMAVCQKLSQRAVMAQGTNVQTSEILKSYVLKIDGMPDRQRAHDWIEGYMTATRVFIFGNLVVQRFRLVGETDPRASWNIPAGVGAGQLETCFTWLGSDKPFTDWVSVADQVAKAPGFVTEEVSKGSIRPI